MERVDAPNAGAHDGIFSVAMIRHVVHLVCPSVFACFHWVGLNLCEHFANWGEITYGF